MWGQLCNKTFITISIPFNVFFGRIQPWNEFSVTTHFLCMCGKTRKTKVCKGTLGKGILPVVRFLKVPCFLDFSKSEVKLLVFSLLTQSVWAQSVTHYIYVPFLPRLAARVTPLCWPSSSESQCWSTTLSSCGGGVLKITAYFSLVDGDTWNLRNIEAVLKVPSAQL